MQYGVDAETEHIDYDQVRDLAREHRPKMIICGGSAIPRLIDFAAFREIADEVGAILMVDAAHFIGLVAGKAIPSPVPYADVVTFTTHKVLRGPRGGMIVCKAEHARPIDKAVFPMMQGGPLMHAVAAKAVNLKECAAAGVPGLRPAGDRQRPGAHRGPGRRGAAAGHRRHRHPPGAARPAQARHSGVTGKDAEARCDAAGIVLNKNAIPYDPQPPSVASGIRVGSPSVTTQGMTEGDMKEIAALIGRAIRDADGTPHRGGRRRGQRAGRRPPGVPRAYPRTRLTPMREYAVVLLAAALVTFLATPVARVAAVRCRVMAEVRDRDVHAIPTPRGRRAGDVPRASRPGVLVATQLPTLQRSFEFSTQTIAVLVAGGLICLLGVLDDRFGLDALTKLAGQIAAAGVMVAARRAAGVPVPAGRRHRHAVARAGRRRAG